MAYVFVPNKGESGPVQAGRVAGVPVTQVQVPARNDLRLPCPFKVGDRVRMKGARSLVGTVAMIPDPRKPVVELAGHVLGNEMGVDLDAGGRAVADVDKWEVA